MLKQNPLQNHLKCVRNWLIQFKTFFEFVSFSARKKIPFTLFFVVFFSDRKTKWLSLVILFLLGVTLSLYFGRKTVNYYRLSSEDVYIYSNYKALSIAR